MISGDEYILAIFLRLTRIRFLALKSSLLTSSTVRLERKEDIFLIYISLNR